jgi:hypothetical protein
MSQMANEIGLGLPISINHPWFLALIGKAGFPINFSDFYGKTGRFDGSLPASGGATYTIFFSNAPFFGGQLSSMNGDASNDSNLFFSVAPNWAGNIKAINNTTGLSCVMPKIGSTTWGGTVGNILRPGQTDSITILPSN